MTSKGQVTISAKARKTLGLDQGDTLIEMVVGNCIVLLPQNQILADTARKAQEAIKLAGVSAEEIIAEAEKLKAEKLSQRYPGL
ncbi:MAG: AbrB/MazE/SpoVT family DNA-binding domain-containing protein [Candidatus Obscuribacterales bacterium]|nr:AbrB/MazE/SpoVT family DNA-binding domain-containing protein [Candidatus Obscuribacterales bacterium]